MFDLVNLRCDPFSKANAGTITTWPPDLDAVALDEPKLVAGYSLRIRLEDAAVDAKKITFEVWDPEDDTKALNIVVFTLTEDHSLDADPLDPTIVDTGLAATVELTIDLGSADAKSRFEKLGVAGLTFSPDHTVDVNAELSAIKLQLRPARPDGGWGHEAPFFALLGCWNLKGSAAGAVIIADKEAAVGAGATAEIMACAGFAVMHPPGLFRGVEDILFRLDLESFALSTGWQPLALIDFTGLSLFHFSGFGKWFAALCDLPDLPNVALPDWSLHIPIDVDMPLGLSFQETRFSLARVADTNTYRATAQVSGLVLSWRGSEPFIYDDFAMSLSFENVSGTLKYVADVRLAEYFYPRKEDDKDLKFALPFDALGVSAKAFRVRLGLHSSGTVSDLGNVCIETLVEIADLEVTSSLTDSSQNAKPFYETSLRLYARNFAVMTEYAKNADGTPNHGPDFFDAIAFRGDTPDVVKDIFAKYKQEYQTKFASADTRPLTFFRNFDAPPPTSPANDYGVSFIDGEFRKGERVYLAWTQNAEQMLRALAHDLFGEPPAGTSPGAKTSLGLEIAWFGEDQTQIRLDWRDLSDELPPAQAPATLTDWVIPKEGDPYLEEDKVSGDTVIPLPIVGYKPMALDEAPANAIGFSVPGVSFEMARPEAQSIVVRQEPAGWSASYVFLYRTLAATGNAAQVARARIGFALGDENGGRDVVQEDGQTPFLTVGLGYGGAETTALRVVGWQKGGKLRFFETLSKDAPPPNIIAPDINAIALPLPGDCPPSAPPVFPPVSLPFEQFDTPQFKGSGWQLAFKLQALEQVMKLFGDAQGTQPTLKLEKIIYERESGDLLIACGLNLRLTLGSKEYVLDGDVTFRLDPSDFSVSIEDAAALTIKLPIVSKPGWAARTPLPELAEGYERHWAGMSDLLGLEAHVYMDVPKGSNPKEDQLDFLTLELSDGRLRVTLADAADMVLRYTGFGRDALAFLVTEFELGSGGVNLNAKILGSSIGVKGLKSPFDLEEAELIIVENRLVYLSVSASGTLPAILDNAPVSLTVCFEQNDEGDIDIASMVCVLASEDQPIEVKRTRFEFCITCLELRYLEQDGARDFFFEVTGSAQFTPKAGEFENGLLENLKSVRCEFVRAPLSDEFIKNLSFMVELNEPVSFDMYNLFRMDIRSIGFDPNFDEFSEPGAAIVIGGQCEFAELGDVVSAEIDFHACRIGFPKTGESLPQIHFEGLRVDISSPEGFRIGGRVDRYEDDTIRGFAGEGTVQIPGFPELSAAFAFVRLRADTQSPWKHAWFIAVEASKVSYQMAPLPIYLRQIGMGFGYRYTLPLIRSFEEEADTLADLIDRMLKALDRHQTLARIDSWVPEPVEEGERAKWTVAMEAVFTLGTTQANPFEYDAKKEAKLKTVIAQILAAIRSDFTLVAAAKVWYPVSVDDFFRDEKLMRSRPLVRGFMIYSAPQKRFLAHAAKSANPYLGKEDDPWPKEVHQLFDNSHFEATMLIEPGLLHAELGWPDRLMMRWQIGSLSIELRAGALLRIENDAIVQGLFFSARGGMELSGGISLGFTGLRLSARVDVYFATRLMMALYLTRPLDSKLYAEIGLDLSVRFTVEAWLRIKIGFCKVTFTVRFSFSIQIVVGLQLGWNGVGSLGFKGRATVIVGVFGRSLRARIAVGINSGAVDGARAALLPYMSSFLAPGEPPHVPDGNILNQERMVNAERAKTKAQVFAPRSPAAATQGPAAPMRAASGGASAFGRSAGLATGPSIRDDVDDAIVLPLDGSDLTRDNFDMVLALTKVSPRLKTVAEAPFQLGDESFVLSYVEGRLHGQKAYYIWIMPGPGKANFYPAHFAGDGAVGEKAFAEINNIEGSVFTFQSGGWKGGNTLFCNHGKQAEFKNEAGKVEGLDLKTLLAGSFVPEGDEHYFDEWQADAGKFPEEYKREVNLLLPIDPVGDTVQLRDDRLMNTPEARNPKRTLDPNHIYDQAIIAAMDAADAGASNAEEALRDQALGNQSFLLQSFYDDLIEMAEEGATTLSASDDRPTLLDLGMVFAVQSDTPPAWLMRRSNGDAKAQPTLTFTTPDAFAPTPPAAPISLQPVVDFELVNFATRPPVFDDPVTFQDEEVLALGWSLRWGGEAPRVARGADTDPESYLKVYHLKIADRDTGRTLLEQTVKPGELIGLSSDDAEALTPRLKSRYQVTLSLDAIFAKEARGGQRQRTMLVTITPEDQVGRLTRKSVTLTPNFEPTLTPLPPDVPVCALRADEVGEAAGAKLSWYQPPLPDRPGVAATQSWQLILRPLESVPMGSYPADTAEAENRGLMSLAGQNLLASDLIVDLAGLEPKPFETPPSDAPDEFDFFYEIDLASREDVPGLEESVKFSDLPVYDVDGNRVDQDPNHISHTSWQGFVSRRSASERGGQAWRMFLRALAPQAAGATSDAPKSGLQPVRLVALPAREEPGVALEGDAQPAVSQRPLPHFEWPQMEAPASDPGRLAQVVGVHGTPGTLHVPSLIQEIEDTDAGLHDQLGSATITYAPAATRDRVITLQWPALANSATETGRETFEATSEYDLFVTDLDRLLNADLKPESGFAPHWSQIARVLPSDLRVVGETPDTMDDGQNWVSYPPARSAEQAWFERESIVPRDRTDAAPGWYGWGESMLAWPDPLGEANGMSVSDRFARMAARATMSPAEIAALQRRSADGKKLRPAGALLSAWYDLGVGSGGGRLHPWLALIIGHIAGQRMAPNEPDAERTAVADQVEVNPGPAVTERAPLSWMASNMEALDPQGWAALGHLGLGVTMTLRDPDTGLTRSQDWAVERLKDAIRDIDTIVDHNISLAELTTLQNALRPNLVDWSNGSSNVPLTKENIGTLLNTFAFTPGEEAQLRDMLDAEDDGQRIPRGPLVSRLAVAFDDLGDLHALAGSLKADISDAVDGRNAHFMIERPLQTEWARRAAPHSPRFADASLRMLHISLRPVPKRLARLATATIKAPLNADAKAPAALRIQWRNRAKAEVRVPKGAQLGRYLSKNDRVYVLREPAPPGEAETLGEVLGAGLSSSDIESRENKVPLSLEDDAKGIRASAFGAFSADPEFWYTFWPGLTRIDGQAAGDGDDATPGAPPVVDRVGHVHMNRALSYITRAFQAVTENGGKTAADHLEDITQDVGALPLYQRWSTRFFTVGPIPHEALTQAQSFEVPFRTAVAARKSIAPVRLAPDAEGLLQLTVPVAENWATSRSFAVTYTDRYARFRQWLKGESGTSTRAKPAMDEGLRTDVHLPRIKKIEPPQVLGQRLLSPPGDILFHELTVARHAEEYLHNTSTPMRRKLGFGALTRSYSRQFRFEEWLAQLKAAKWISGEAAAPQSPASEDTRVANTTRPDIEETRRSLLAHVPKARFGSSVHITPADPFWYITRVRLDAFATEEDSEPTVVDLPPSKPAQITRTPKSGPPNAKGLSRKDWTVSEDPLFVLVKSRLDAWRDSGDLPVNTPYMVPEGQAVTLNLPRLIDSLPEATVKVRGLYHQEDQPAAFGRLPDPSVSFQVVAQVAGVSQSLAKISAATDVPYDVETVSAQIEARLTLGEEYKAAAWQDGVPICLRFRPASDSPETTAGSLVPPSNLEPTEVDMLAAGAMPSTGPLAQLLGLALRLQVDEEDKLHYVDPIYGRRGIVRPHLDLESFSGQAPMQKQDLRAGLVSVLCPDHRNALAGLGWDVVRSVKQKDPATEVGLRDIMRQVEEADLAYLSPKVDGLDLSAFAPDDLVDAGIQVWLRQEDATGKVSWTAYSEETPSPVDARLLVIAPEAEAATFADIAALAVGAVQPVPARQSAARAASETLAKLGYRKTAVPDPDIYIQRGNAPRRLWWRNNRTQEEG